MYIRYLYVEYRCVFRTEYIVQSQDFLIVNRSRFTVFDEIRNGPTCKTVLVIITVISPVQRQFNAEHRDVGDSWGWWIRRHWVAVYTSMQEPESIDSTSAGDSMQTVLVEPLSGPSETVVECHASPMIHYYIPLVDTTIMAAISIHVKIVSPPP